jgi:hypothetical protein
MAGYLAWIARRMDAEGPGWLRRIQDHATDLTLNTPGYGRHATTFAYLLTGWLVWLEFAQEVGAVTDAEATGWVSRVYETLTQTAIYQNIAAHDNQPERVFLLTIRDLISSGAVRLAALDGSRPPDAARWGYPADDSDAPGKGQRVGWVDATGIYLMPAPTQELVIRSLTNRGEHYATKDRMLRDLLRRAGYLRHKGTKTATGTMSGPKTGCRMSCTLTGQPLSGYGITHSGRCYRFGSKPVTAFSASDQRKSGAVTVVTGL